MESTQVPVAIRSAARDWGIVLGSRLRGATCSDVFEGVDPGGRRVVLKAPHSHAEERNSIETLQEFSKFGGVEVLGWDAESEVILMPRLSPGGSLDKEPISDDERLAVCAGAIKRLRKAKVVQGAYPLEHFFPEDAELPDSPMFVEAKRLARHLFETTTERCLLHGDLHHFNLLRNGSDWVVIDPKGVVGDPAFEVAAYLRNPFPASFSVDVCRRRLTEFQRLLGDPIERLWGWSFCQTAMCSMSGLADGPWRETAESLLALKSEFWH
jgi:streptomycin 6-kinase